MKPRLPVIAVVSALVLVIAYQAYDSYARGERFTRERLAYWRQVRELEKKLVTLQEQNQSLKAESEALRKKRFAEGVALAPPSAEPALEKGPVPPAETKPAEPKPAANPMAQMMSNPAMQKMARQQQGFAVTMMYSPLAKELGLDEQQSTAVMALLKERQEAMFDASVGMFTAGEDKAAAAAAAEQADATRKRYDEKFRSLLGEQYPGFESYERSLADRMVLGQFQLGLSAGGQSLSDEQRSSMLQIMVEERAKSPQTTREMDGRNARSQLALMQSDEALHGFFAEQEDLNRRVLSRAADVLSPEQVTALEKFQKQLATMQQAGVQMMRGK